MNAKEQLLTDLKHYGLKQGKVTLSSGIESDWYVDAAQVLLRGDMFETYGQAIEQSLKGLPQFTAVGGLTMGADPLALVIAATTKAKAFSIRKTAKGHGAEAKRIVGPLNSSDRILIVDDVTTSGNSLKQSIEALADYEVVAAFCLLDRSGGAADELLTQHRLPYRALFTDRDFVN